MTAAPVRAWRFARRFTGPAVALLLVAMSVAVPVVLIAADPYR